MAPRRLAMIAIAAIAILAAASLVEGYGGRLGGITEVKNVKKNEEVQKLGRFCVEEFNRRSRRNGDGEVKFDEVVAAQKQVVSGLKYYLKISAIQNGKSKMFDSVVILKPWLPSKHLLHFAPSTDFILNKF